MREIKFRAWDNIYNKMWFPTAIKSDGSNVALIQSYGAYLHEMNNDPIMQYTGLKDKRGKEIYEGDIVVRLCGGGICTVEFFKNRFSYRYSKWLSDLDLPFEFDSQEFEIIGNIYENPELLETDTVKDFIIGKDVTICTRCNMVFKTRELFDEHECYEGSIDYLHEITKEKL